MKGWIAIAVGAILIFVGCYLAEPWIKGLHLLAD